MLAKKPEFVNKHTPNRDSIISFDGKNVEVLDSSRRSMDYKMSVSNFCSEEFETNSQDDTSSLENFSIKNPEISLRIKDDEEKKIEDFLSLDSDAQVNYLRSSIAKGSDSGSNSNSD